MSDHSAIPLGILGPAPLGGSSRDKRGKDANLGMYDPELQLLPPRHSHCHCVNQTLGCRCQTPNLKELRPKKREKRGKFICSCHWKEQESSALDMARSRAQVWSLGQGWSPSPDLFLHVTFTLGLGAGRWSPAAP